MPSTSPSVVQRFDSWCLHCYCWGSLTAAAPAAPPVELLWPHGAPGAKGDQPADKPTLTIFLPDEQKATGTAVVICPGGGYGGLATDHEGRQIAQWFNAFGVAGFMLEYRHRGRGYGHPAPLQDAQRAIRTVRARAAEWKIEPDKNRHHGIFRRRTPGVDGRHAFRPGQTPTRPTLSSGSVAGLTS